MPIETTLKREENGGCKLGISGLGGVLFTVATPEEKNTTIHLAMSEELFKVLLTRYETT